MAGHFLKKAINALGPRAAKPKAIDRFAPGAFAKLLQSELEKGGPLALLRQLHAAELAETPDYIWPWLLWEKLRDNSPALASSIPDIPCTDITDSLGRLILSLSAEMRRSPPKEDTFALLFKDLPIDHPQIEGLPVELKVELTLMAFAERMWSLAVKLAYGLLTTSENNAYDSTTNMRLRALLFDVLVFATYRPEMPGFVKKPTTLMSKLDALRTDPKLSSIINSETITAIVFKANLHAIKGQFPEALKAYGKANAIQGFRSPVFSQAQVMQPVADLDNAKTQAELRKWHREYSDIQFHFRHSPDGEHAIVASADANYFDLYAALYTQIAGKTNPGILLHFHLINMKEDPVKLEHIFKQWETMHAVRINWTLETNKIIKDEPRLLPGISACARYVYLPEYLRAYQSISLSDIDGWLVAPLSKMTSFKDNDILLSSMIWRQQKGYWRLPWGNLSAGYLSINATEKSLRCACQMAAYLMQLYKKNAYTGRPIFYADQAGFFLCLQYAVKEYEMQIGFLRGGFAQSDEQRYHARYTGKQVAMQKKLHELDRK